MLVTNIASDEKFYVAIKSSAIGTWQIPAYIIHRFYIRLSENHLKESIRLVSEVQYGYFGFIYSLVAF